MKNKCYIAEDTSFILLDDEGNIRGTADSLVDIVKLKEEYGWGDIHRATFDCKKLEIGEIVE